MARLGRSQPFPTIVVKGGTSDSGVTIAVPVGAITVTGYAPTMDRGIIPPVGAIVTLGYAPTMDKGIIPPVGAIAVLGYAPTMDRGIIPPVGAISVLGYAPTNDRGIPVPVGTIVVAGLAPIPGVVITTGVGSISITGYAPKMDKGIIPPVGSIVVTGYAPVVTVVISIGAGAITISGEVLSFVSGQFFAPGAGAITVTGYAPLVTVVISIGAGAVTTLGYAPTMNKGIVPPVGAITISGLVPTMGKGIIPPVGAITVTGLAPTMNKAIVPPVGAITISGLAPTMGKGIIPPVGTITVTGLAPSLVSLLVITPPVGAITVLGYAPFVDTPIPDTGGGGPGLLIALGLNLSNRIIAVPAGSLTISGKVTAWGANYKFSPAQAALAITGRTPSPQISGGPQAPTMQNPVALTITGLAPQLHVGIRVLFPFDTDAQGFVGTPGPGTTMVWSGATGNPVGSLRGLTTGFGRADNNVWTLTTDWQTLGVPADTVITGISLVSADTRATNVVNGAGTFNSVRINPTGYPSIQIAPSRPITVSEATWTTSSGSGVSGLEIPSGGSLTITAGTDITTEVSGTPEVRVFHDNINFVVSFTPAKRITPDPKNLTITGLIPTLVKSQNQAASPPNGSLSILGLGPSVFVTTPITGGGGGPGLLLGLALNLEPRALGSATLVITGYAPTVFRPIVLLGGDELLSQLATVSSNGGHVISGASPTYFPAQKALTITGLVPTVVQTGSRLFAMPVTALTITRYVPTVGISHVVRPGVGSITVNGFGPSVEPNYIVSPQIGSASFLGRAPAIFVPVKVLPGVGSITASGLAPSTIIPVVIPVPAGTLVAAGAVPTSVPVDAHIIVPPTGSITAAGYSPGLGTSHVRAIPVGLIKVDGFGPATGGNSLLSPLAGSAQITGLAPVTLIPVTAQPGAGAITTAGLAPSIVRIALPANAALAITGLAPTMVRTDHHVRAIPATALVIAGLVPTAGINHVRSPGLGEILIDGFGPSLTTPPPAQITVSPGRGTALFEGYVPLSLIAEVGKPGVGSVVVTGYAPTVQGDVTFAPGAGSIVVTGYSYIVSYLTVHGSPNVASQAATVVASGVIRKHGSGVLASPAPLLFLGTGSLGHTTTAALQSGPASLLGSIATGDIFLQSQSAKILCRAQVIRFTPQPRRQKGTRVNRYNVVLKSKPRMKHRKPRR